jgi:tRNA wybutosine-synthesizing protein 3
MENSSFIQSKESVLSRLDQSSIGEWDKKIIPLCDKINSLEDYYTSSSCSGRIILMIDQDKKGEGLFLFTSHNLVSFEELKKELDKILKSKNKKDIKFKTEAPILHVFCFNLESAKTLYDLAKLSGFKKSGIISFGRKIVLEINSGEKIEFPVIQKGKFLVNEDFLKIVLKESNKKLKKGWEKLERLSTFIKK